MKKLNNKKGFTLMEMLIVVAIIAILIAIAIPTFSGSLKSAKQAADNANVRAVYSEAMTMYLTNVDGGTGTATTDTAMQAAYDGKTLIGGVTPYSWEQGDYVKVTVTAPTGNDTEANVEFSKGTAPSTTSDTGETGGEDQ